MSRTDDRNVPISAALLLGIGLGVFFDDIVRESSLFDAIVRAAAWGAVVIALFILRHRLRLPPLALLAAFFIGLGGFPLVEEPAWRYWDLGFIAFGALMIVAGWRLKRTPKAALRKPRAVERRKRPMRWRPGDRRSASV